MSTDQIQYNNQLFKNLIPIYDAVAVFLIPVRNKIIKELKLPKNSKVLDVACGTGTQALSLAKKNYEVTGIDLSSVMLKRAQEKMDNKYPVHFILGDATKLPFKSHVFDASIISFGLHDMPESIRTKVLQEMKRVTKKHGRILVADYATPTDGFLAEIERPISNLFESKYFESFMKTGLNPYLQRAKLVVKKRIILLTGIAQLVICKNS